MSIVSNNIKYLRKLSGLTQEQFANKIEIKRSLLGAYEEARANPNLTNLENMAAAFGISVDKLIKNDLRQSGEHSELSLPFTRSTQMTVSHSGMLPAPRKQVAAEHKYQERTVPIQNKETPTDLPKQFVPTKNDHIAEQKTNSDNPFLEKDQTHKSPIGETIIPAFNNRISERQSASPIAKTFPSIQLVSLHQQQAYIRYHQNPSFVASLPVFQLPNLPHDYYRAFETGSDFLYPGALLIGSFTRNWYDVREEVNYIFVLKNSGIIYRKALNEVQINGSFCLISDLNGIQPMHVPLADILEVWEVKAFVSLQMPVAMPSLDKVGKLVEELQKELQRK